MTDKGQQQLSLGWAWSRNGDDVVRVEYSVLPSMARYPTQPLYVVQENSSGMAPMFGWHAAAVYDTDEAAWKALMAHHAKILVTAQKQMKEATERLSNLASSHAAWTKKRNKV